MDALPPSIIKGLEFAADETKINDETWTQCLSSSFYVASRREGLARQEEESRLEGEMKAVTRADAKEAYAAVLGLILEAVKHSSSAQEMAGVLDEAGLSAERIQQFQSHYAEMKPQIADVLAQTSFALPNVVGFDWRLDYQIKSDVLEQVRQPQYSIKVKTQQPDGSLKDVDFTCNYQELQDLLFKLEDATKQVQRILTTSSE
jgi:hypothetical protein